MGENFSTNYGRPKNQQQQKDPVTEQKRTIYLKPIGPMESRFAPDNFIEVLRDYVAAFYQLPCTVLGADDLASLPDDSRRIHDGKPQYKTGTIISRVRESMPRDAYCVCAVTMVDLYPDDAWNFVFGQAAPPRRCGVFSFARKEPDFYGDQVHESMFQRAKVSFLIECLKTLTHELGHLMGISHCVFFNCLMNGSNHAAESEGRPELLCPVCLRKAHLVIGFDFKARYNQLRDVLSRVGSDKVPWVISRIELC